MNCADSVLNSDELPVRGIDQCPSTLSTQWNPGLVLVKWNRLQDLFKRAWLYSCFVEAEAFLKCVNLCRSRGSNFSPPFIQGSDIVCLRFSSAAHFASIFAVCSLRTSRFDSEVKTCFFFPFKNNHTATLKQNNSYEQVNCASRNGENGPPSKHAAASQTYSRCVMRSLVTYLWPLNDSFLLKWT